jgi:hypothetical protein
MAKTRDDLVQRALKNLGVLPQGQVPNVQEYNAVNDLVDSTVEDLIGRDVVYIDDVEAIDEKYFMPLALILASNCRAEFGLTDDPALPALAQKSERDLQQISRVVPTFKTLKVEAY